MNNTIMVKIKRRYDMKVLKLKSSLWSPCAVALFVSLMFFGSEAQAWRGGGGGFHGGGGGFPASRAVAGRGNDT
jgi:hypothetical protein